ncbi:MAG: multidrug effflux MFS transporter [Steroidobacteraceae bacterium]|nr:multidrug effflux MFS transporter [Steroidobacteraceae bacterium]
MTARLSDRALLILLAAIAALGPIATNLYLPALPAVREHFGASVAAVQATFSVSLVSFAFGILAWGPIADRYGRRTAVLGGLGIMIAGALVSLAAPDLRWLVVGRAVQAFGTATGIVVARAILSDVYPIERMSRALAQVTMVAVLGNSLAPVLGGFIAAGFGWRSIFTVLVAAATVIGLVAWRRLPETRPPTDRPPRGHEMAATAWRLVRMPMFAGCVLQSAVVYATFLVFISLAPYVMVSAFGRPPTEFGFYYLFIAVGYFLGNWSVGRFMSHHDLHWMVVTGVLWSAIGAVAALAFVALGFTHPLWLFVPIGVLSYGQGLALPNVTATAVSLAPQHAGVASSTIGFLQQIIGAACVQWMGHFSTDTALPMLLFCAIVCLLGLALLYVFPRVGK